MGLLRTILVLVIAWFVFRLLDSWWASRKQRQRGGQHHQRYGQSGSGSRRSSSKDQEVIIDYDPRMTRSHTRDDAGEVVDFEEVEDDPKS